MTLIGLILTSRSRTLGAAVILLDTNILIDYELYAFDPEETYSASVLSRAELEFGICKAPTAQEREIRQAVLADLDTRFKWKPFDLRASQGYGIVAGTAPVSGAKVRSKDALIAGQAYSLQAGVMTRNMSDFAPFSHLVTIIPAALKPLARG
jgi:predicted nucleic acid-binding protein